MTSKFNIDGEAVRKLAEILVETDLSEIEYEDNGSRIYVSRKTNIQTTIAPQMVTNSGQSFTSSVPTSAAAASQPTDWAKHPGAVRSPMVGTVYMASEPGAANFVKLGDTISAGQTLLIVEAMKVMNQIKAPHAGKITQLFVTDASPVEYDEPLMIIE
jgi:acetyl-CoA carboxylase biotin carboxyl carrier protein